MYSTAVYMALATIGATEQSLEHSVVESAKIYFNDEWEDALVKACSDEVQSLLVSYGVAVINDQLRWLKEAKFPRDGWETRLLTCARSANAYTMILEYLDDKTDYSYMIDEDFKNCCKQKFADADESYFRFVAFLVNTYGDGCSCSDIEVIHSELVSKVVKSKRTKTLISRFGVTKPEWVVSTILGFNYQSMDTERDCNEHLYRIIRRTPVYG